VSLTKKEIVDLYRIRARHYDFTANLYYLMGFREFAYRKRAIRELKLSPGETVVEIGCGTGLNFPLLQKYIGTGGRIIGVDLTDSMLEKAGERVESHGWQNVELVRSDAALYQFPGDIDGVLSTFAITLSPDYDKIILNGCRALREGKRWVILDFKMPSGLPSRLVPLMLFITRPFGVTMDLADRHPWKSIEKYMANTAIKELFMGFAYISFGEKKE
jgi:ubiquinone/menaquinone biosynthesis C-methylase UbiE